MKILAPQTVIVSADESSNYQALYFSSFAITFGSAPAWLAWRRPDCLHCLPCLNIIERTIIMKTRTASQQKPEFNEFVKLFTLWSPYSSNSLVLTLHLHQIKFLAEINFPTKKFHVLEHSGQCDTSNYKPYGGSGVSFNKQTSEKYNIKLIYLMSYYYGNLRPTTIVVRQVCKAVIFNAWELMIGEKLWQSHNFLVLDLIWPRLFSDIEHFNQSQLMDGVLTKCNREKCQLPAVIAVIFSQMMTRRQIGTQDEFAAPISTFVCQSLADSVTHLDASEDDFHSCEEAEVEYSWCSSWRMESLHPEKEEGESSALASPRTAQRNWCDLPSCFLLLLIASR